MASLKQSSLPVEEASLKPKRRLLDFDESDKESDPEADDLDAELTRFCLNFIVSLLKSSSGRYRNEPTLDKELDPLGWWRNRKQEYPILVRLVRKYQRPSHKHAGGEGLQLDGLDAQQEKIEHVGRECDEDNMRSSEVDFYIFLLSWFLSVVDIYNKLLDTILTYA